MSDVEGIVRAAVEKRMETLRANDGNFRRLQEEKLAALVRRNEDTEFGRAHGFADIDSVAAFRERVPVSTADDYAAAWERVAAGERGVLFADPVHAFGLSSGTTGAAKLVPLTKALVRGLKRAIGYTTASYMASCDDYSLLRGYALQMSAAGELRRSGDGVPVGYITGIIGAARTYPFHNIGIPTQDVLDLEDWSEKFRVIEERYLDHDVRMIFGVPAYAAGLLHQVTTNRGVPDVRALWPNLGLVVTSGGALSTFRERFERLCPGAAFREMYLATEAPFGFEASDGRPGMTPMVEDVFLEFVPEGAWGRPDAPRRSLWEVEAGARYVPLVTTPAGLYAYSPGDVVEFVATDPPRFVVRGRYGNFLNIATEKMDGAQAAAALARAGLPCENFTVCPADGPVTRHAWILEPDGALPEDAAARIDRALVRANVLYRQAREGGDVLAAPRVRAVRPGTFERALRRRAGQGKILRIYQDRAVHDELLELDGDAPPA